MRDRIIDIYKGIAIILVVIGHSGFLGANFIYLFHMSLFYFSSGYFFKESNLRNRFSILKYLKKVIQKLYLPFVLYGFVFILMHNFFIKNGVIDGQLYDSYEIVQNFMLTLTLGTNEKLLGTFWFFVSLLEVEVIFLMIFYINKISLGKTKDLKIITICVFILFFIGVILSYFHIRLPRVLDTSLTCLIFYYLGFIFKKRNLKKLISFKLVICAIFFLVVLNQFGQISIGNNQFPNIMFLIVSSISGIILVYWLSSYINKVNHLISVVLAYIGKKSIYIMIYHFLAFKVITFLLLMLFDDNSSYLAEFPIVNEYSKYWYLYCIGGLLLPIIIGNSSNRVYRYFKKISIDKCRINV